MSETSTININQQAELEQEIKQQKQKYKSLEEVRMANDAIHAEYV